MKAKAEAKEREVKVCTEVLKSACRQLVVPLPSLPLSLCTHIRICSWIRCWIAIRDKTRLYLKDWQNVMDDLGVRVHQAVLRFSQLVGQNAPQSNPELYLDSDNDAMC